MSPTLNAITPSNTTTPLIVAALSRPDAYPEISATSVEMHETHISWVFLVGDYAFKVKKPVKTAFLDYSTLSSRKHYCEEELRLDSRFADDLYLGVIPICEADGRLVVAGTNEPVEYAVKMRRFRSDAMLSNRLASGKLTTADVLALAQRISDFHRNAIRLHVRRTDNRLGAVAAILDDANDNLRDLNEAVGGQVADKIDALGRWTAGFFDQHRHVFRQRACNGFIRECHGDLHLANIVYWNGQLVPFDGIEFNEAFRWIDVISDAAFTAMDFAARGRWDLSRSFINAYLQQTGDHMSLSVLRWYLVYRALVRAKVAAVRAAQTGLTDTERTKAMADCEHHVQLAQQFSRQPQPALWITHGVSGSGKTTLSELVIQRHGAIRLRSDIERKRHFGMSPTQRPSEATKAELYSDSTNQATYSRLRRLARCILRAGFPVVIDATFLLRCERTMFKSLATAENAEFAILDCNADQNTLRQRIIDRMAGDKDASDADIKVLEDQLASHEPLDASELTQVVAISDLT